MSELKKVFLLLLSVCQFVSFVQDTCNKLEWYNELSNARLNSGLFVYWFQNYALQMLTAVIGQMNVPDKGLGKPNVSNITQVMRLTHT